MDISFFDYAHEFYGYGKIEVGERIQVDKPKVLARGDTLTVVQKRVHSYAKISGKKFRTRTADGSLHIMRVK